MSGIKIETLICHILFFNLVEKWRDMYAMLVLKCILYENAHYKKILYYKTVLTLQNFDHLSATQKLIKAMMFKFKCLNDLSLFLVVSKQNGRPTLSLI